ncbi:zinc-binding protein A33-like [Hemitrygon akajei]|uniref:zinc-binding protein A33-like n=1 Tax=Hemitrygon akajei TaxID=2704970 RepID=UPI003BF9D7A9
MEERNSCPECREVFADCTLRVSWALANLAEKARNLNLNPKGNESKLHCKEHEEELKLFCETDKTLICLICRDAQEHREHRFLPIKEAVKIYKDQLKSSLDFLTKNKSDFLRKEQQQKQKIFGVQKQLDSIESHIISQFAELHQIITEKEQSLLWDLRKEEARILYPMDNNLREIQKNIRIIQKEISQLKEQMDQNDSVIFLKMEARRNSRINDDVAELSATDAAHPFEKFDHPYLLNKWLSGILDAITLDSVTLDVETANLCLEVSEDRKSVRWTGTWRDLPDTGKRFTDWECVLGSEGFTSGRHYWEVEVTENRGWCLGVTAESAQRAGVLSPSPETGFWVIRRYYEVMQPKYRRGIVLNYDSVRQDYDVISVHTSPESRLPAGPIPGRMGVYLNYESGTVSFYDAETKSLLHTFTENKFTEKLYPFFRTWITNQWLRICSVSAPGM